MNHVHVRPSRFVHKLATAAVLCAAAWVPSCKSTFHHSVRPPTELREGLTLEAGAECRSRAHFGGAVSPGQWALRVVNRSGLGTGWRLRSNQTWLTIPGELGSTAPRAESLVLVNVDPDAGRALGVGEHRARVELFAADDPARAVGSVEIVLEVVAGASPAVDDLLSSTDPRRGGQVPSDAPASSVSSALVADPGHWTDLQVSPDSRLVYVSNSTGNDANDGLSPDHPKASIAAGKALLRHGYPDWLLLKRGDTWAGSLGQWIVSGRSETEPVVLSSYGNAEHRPHIATGTQDGLFTIQNSASPAVLRHIRIVGLRFTCNGYTGSEGTPRGIGWHVPFEDVLVEDCAFQYFHTNVVIEPLGELGRDFRMRRCVIADAFTTQSSHSQGLYVANTEGVLLEENLFDHNGWRTGVAGAVPTIFRHNAYLQTNTTAVRVLGNIFASGASHGLQARQGGLVEDNLFVDNAIGLLLGSDWQTKEPIRFIARRNVITKGRDIDPATPRGFGIDVPAADSGLIARNLIVNQRNVGFPVAINLYDGTNAVGVHDVVVEGNIVHDWMGSVILQGQAPLTTGLVLRQNVICDTLSPNLLVDVMPQPNGSIAASADNTFWSRIAPPNGWCRIGNGNVSLDMWKAAVGDTTSQASLPNYVDPERGIDRYDLSIGGDGSQESFLARARRQSRQNWRPELMAVAANAWIREGFRWVE